MTEPITETARLILRRPLIEDLDRWAEMMANADAARFIGGVSPKPVVWRSIMQVRGMWEMTGVARRLGSTVLGPGRMPPPFDHETIDLWGQRREDWARNRAQILTSLDR